PLDHPQVDLQLMAANCTCPDCRHKRALDIVRRHFARDDHTGGLHAAVSYLQAELKKDRDHRPAEAPAAHAMAAGKILLLASLVPTVAPRRNARLVPFPTPARRQPPGEHDDAA